MKKSIQILFAALAVVALVSCGKKGPEPIAEKFLQHLNKKEYAEAKKLGTEATGQMLDFLASFPSDGAIEEVKITDMKCEVVEENATCTYKANDKEDSIKLVMKDGKWFVDMPKEMPEDMMMEEPVMEEEVVVETPVVE
jgi:predicted small lipoprotein YifL